MISQKLIKSLDFQNITEYFDYILTSIENGQNKQAKELYIKLSSKQKLNFYWFLNDAEKNIFKTLDI